MLIFENKSVFISGKSGREIYGEAHYVNCMFYFNTPFSCAKFKDCSFDNCKFIGETDIVLNNCNMVKSMFDPKFLFVQVQNMNVGQVLTSLRPRDVNVIKKFEMHVDFDCTVDEFKYIREVYKKVTYYVEDLANIHFFDMPPKLREMFIREEVPKLYTKWDSCHMRSSRDGNIHTVYVKGGVRVQK